jgi:hypothetical protein
MKILSAILIIFGSIGIAFQTMYAFIFHWDMAAHFGNAAGFAIAFLLPGIILYIKSSKRTTDSKGGQYKGDIDATKTEEPNKEKHKEKEGGKT